MPQSVPEVRLRPCNDQPARADGKHVLYWMTGARRSKANFALQRAVEHGGDLGATVRDGEVGQPPAEHLRPRVAGDALGAGVPLVDAVVEVLADDRRVGRLDDAAQVRRRRLSQTPWKKRCAPWPQQRGKMVLPPAALP